MHPTWVSFRSPKSTMISRWLRRAGIGRRCARFSMHLNRKGPEPRWRAPASGRLEMGRRAGTMAKPLNIAIIGAGMGGLETRMRSQSFYPRSWNNRDWKSGDVKFDMIFGESAEEKFGAPYLLTHRGDLHAALASAVPEECLRLS